MDPEPTTADTYTTTLERLIIVLLQERAWRERHLAFLQAAHNRQQAAAFCAERAAVTTMTERTKETR